MMSTALEVFTAELIFPEGPTWHDGSLWVSDVIAGGVIRIDGRGGAEHHLERRRGIGGLLTTSDGRLLATGADLVDITTGETVLERPADFTGFNDIGVDATGAILIGVLTYRPIAGDTPTGGSVARWDGDRADWHWFQPVTWPNGIGMLSDGNIVVVDYYDGTLRVIDPGRHTSTVICQSASGHYDGLCIDDDDHIWVATGPGASIEQRDRTGRLLHAVDLPADFVTSVCFAGDDARTLLVTVAGCRAANGGGAVLAIRSPTPGRPPAPARVDLGGSRAAQTSSDHPTHPDRSRSQLPFEQDTKERT